MISSSTEGSFRGPEKLAQSKTLTVAKVAKRTFE
jgi:hypothetical protein